MFLWGWWRGGGGLKFVSNKNSSWTLFKSNTYQMSLKLIKRFVEVETSKNSLKDKRFLPIFVWSGEFSVWFKTSVNGEDMASSYILKWQNSCQTYCLRYLLEVVNFLISPLFSFKLPLRYWLSKTVAVVYFLLFDW